MKPYLKYKDSGVEWIGEVPEHWEIKKIKHSTYVKGRVGWHGLSSNDFIDDGPFLVTGTDFLNGKINWETCYHVSMVNGIYLISERCVNTLILVHRKQLLDQWISRLKTFLEIPEDAIGQISGGKWTPTFKIDVATIQSLRKKGIVNDVIGQYGHLIIDECHIVPARSFEIVARQCKARYITGLSATVIRKDGHHPIIIMNCGPVRYRVDDKKQAVQRPFHHKVFIRKTKFSLPTELLNKETLQIHEIYNAMIEDEERNQMIVTDVINALSQKRSPIVLTERISHLEKLASMLSPHTRNLLILRGGMGEKQRRLVTEKLQSIQDDEERLIIATGRYIGEGFDDNRLDTLFLTLPVSWKGTIAQYAGRLHRLYEMKNEVLIFDYSDLESAHVGKNA